MGNKKTRTQQRISLGIILALIPSSSGFQSIHTKVDSSLSSFNSLSSLRDNRREGSSSSSIRRHAAAFPSSSSSSSSGGGRSRGGGAGGGASASVKIMTASERLTQNEPILREIAAKLDEAGLGKTSLVQDKSLGPGLHNQHYRFETSDYGPVFVKLNHRFGFIQNFQQEIEGLRVIQETNTLRVPQPISCGLLSDGHSYLAMEYIETIPFGPSIKSVAKELGQDLARLHLAPVPFIGDHYGFQHDNFLGMAPQKNEWMEDFSQFFLERRLLPQLHAAGDKLSSMVRWGSSNDEVSPRSFDKLLIKVEKVLEPVRTAKPSLLHGDLWQGNTGATKGRQAFVYDPACWYGHAEFDLALSTLFGGFMPEFYQAYHALIPAEEDFEARAEVYRLYHLVHHLNHYGLGFGSSGSVKDPKGYYERCLQLMRSISAK